VGRTARPPTSDPAHPPRRSPRAPPPRTGPAPPAGIRRAGSLRYVRAAPLRYARATPLRYAHAGPLRYVRAAPLGMKGECLIYGGGAEERVRVVSLSAATALKYQNTLGVCYPCSARKKEEAKDKMGCSDCRDWGLNY